MTAIIDLPIITALSGGMTLHDGGRNFPGIRVVVDENQTDVEQQQIYLVKVMGRNPVLKRCIDRGSSIMLHPVFSGMGDVKTINLFGRDIPCQSIEFSEAISKRHVIVVGRMVGFAPMVEAAP